MLLFVSGCGGVPPWLDPDYQYRLKHPYNYAYFMLTPRDVHSDTFEEDFEKFEYIVGAKSITREELENASDDLAFTEFLLYVDAAAVSEQSQIDSLLILELAPLMENGWDGIYLYVGSQSLWTPYLLELARGIVGIDKILIAQSDVEAPYSEYLNGIAISQVGQSVSVIYANFIIMNQYRVSEYDPRVSIVWVVNEETLKPTQELATALNSITKVGQVKGKIDATLPLVQPEEQANVSTD